MKGDLNFCTQDHLCGLFCSIPVGVSNHKPGFLNIEKVALFLYKVVRNHIGVAAVNFKGDNLNPCNSTKVPRSGLP